MSPSCPICHASPCPEELPECQARAEQRRALWERANGFGLPPQPLIWVAWVARRAKWERR